MHISMRKLIIDFELDSMADYLDVINDSLAEHYKSVEKSIERMTEGISEDEAEYLFDHFIDDLNRAGRELPDLFYLSFIVMWYSFVEQQLLDLCEALNLSISSGPKDRDRFGTGVERYHNFLKKVHGYTIDNQYWEELTTIRKIRNFIVHHGKRLKTHLEKPNRDQSVEYETDDYKFYINIEHNVHEYLISHNILYQSGILVDLAPTYEYCIHLIEFAHEMLFKMCTDLDQ